MINDMRCMICDSDSDSVGIDDTPCAVCQEAIYDCLMGYEKIKPSPEDDDIDEWFLDEEGFQLVSG